MASPPFAPFVPSVPFVPFVLAIAFAALWVATPCVAAPAIAPPTAHRPPPVAHGRVLPPAAGAVVEEAFGRLPSPWRLDGASIEGARVTAKVCRAAGPCTIVALSDPDQPCDGRLVGPWCLVLPADSDPDLTAALTAALAVDLPERVWRVAAAVTPAPPATTATLGEVSLALVLCILPFLFGGVVGAALRRFVTRAGVRWLLAGALVVVPWLFTRPSAGGLPHIGAWDVWFLVIGFDLGALVACWRGRHLFRWRESGALIATLLVIGGAAELVARSASDETEPVSDVGPIELLQRQQRWHGCQLLFPDALAAAPLVPAAVPGRRRQVLHLGDPVLRREGRNTTHFTDLIAQRQPGVAHLGTGLAISGLDSRLLAVQAMVPGRHPSSAVLHLFPAIDIPALDRPSVCCGGESVLVWQDDALTPRCDRPRWQLPYSDWLGRSPPPYALRLAGRASSAARLASRAIRHVGGLIESSDGSWASDPEVKWQHAGAVIAATVRLLEAARVPVVAVLHPDPRSLLAAEVGTNGAKQRHARAAATLADGGLRVLDAWPLFENAVRAQGLEAMYEVRRTGALRLTTDGHVLLAGWLAHELAAGQ